MAFSLWYERLAWPSAPSFGLSVREFVDFYSLVGIEINERASDLHCHQVLGLFAVELSCTCEIK